MTDLNITISINDTDQKILSNDILDINEWCQNAVTGKINNCWKRMQSGWTTKLMNDASFTDPIPSNKTEFISLVTARSGYQTRTERDEAQNAEK
jgi:hypothetical protein|tara:strand:+ start:444 stop:725 length:282 start_codon:yes stop_codon:yes gene_type:complete